MLKRNYSLDLLRCIAMFMILTVHFFGWGDAVNLLSKSDLNYYIVMPIYFISQIGNTLFFLLSGYFLSFPRAKKIIFLERKTAFYSFLITLIIFVLGLNSDWGLKYLIKSAFPILFNKYWFITTYLILAVFSAVLIKGLNQLSKGIIIAVILALLINNTFIEDANMTFMQGLLTFIVGYYLKNFDPFVNFKKFRVALSFILSFILYVIERLLVRHFSIEHSQLDKELRYVLILLMAVLFFEFFTKINIKTEFFSKISPNVLAVYLITANPAFEKFLYGQLLHISDFAKENWFILYYFIINTMIFFACIAIDKVVTLFNNKEVDFWHWLIFKKIRGIFRP